MRSGTGIVDGEVKTERMPMNRFEGAIRSVRQAEKRFQSAETPPHCLIEVMRE